MKRKIIFRKKKINRAQISIAEVVVSATVILVLSFSIAQLGTKVADTNKTTPIEKLKERAQSALNLGLTNGILRELAYATDPSASPAKSQMTAIIDSNLPITAQYSLLQRTLDNSESVFNRILLGITPIPSGNINIFSVSVLLSGYYDSTQIIDVPYVITLIVAVGDF